MNFKGALCMFMGAAAVAGAMSGCARDRDRHLDVFGPIDKQYDDNAGGGDWDGIGEEDLGGPFGDDGAGLSVIYFDYNSSVVKPEAVALLQKDAERLRRGEQFQIQIEGHCDERGTQEYNLALGEERAIAVKETLIRLGVDPSQLATISYGEERPAQSGQSEDAWSKNRRVEFNEPSS